MTLWERAAQDSHHSAQFGGHRHCGSGEVKAFVCDMTLKEKILKESSD